MDNIVELKEITKIYGDKVKTQVLHGLNLSIEKGSFNSIIGQSGSGKSTLLNILGTLDRPSGGEIIINGVNTKAMSSNQLAKLRNETLGFIFQFHFLLPEFTALENVLMPYRIMGKKIDDKVMERANELIELVGLTKVKNNLATQMSGGQQQRTAIARSLMNNPSIILADEPTGNLDSELEDEIIEIFKTLAHEHNKCIIMVTHSKEIADKSDVSYQLKKGVLLQNEWLLK